MATKEGRGHEERAIQLGADRRDSESAQRRAEDCRAGAGAWGQRGDAVRLEEQVRRMEVGEAHLLRSLEEENRRLKHLVADLSLDKEALKAIVRKNEWSLPA